MIVFHMFPLRNFEYTGSSPLAVRAIVYACNDDFDWPIAVDCAASTVAASEAAKAGEADVEAEATLNLVVQLENEEVDEEIIRAA